MELGRKSFSMELEPEELEQAQEDPKKSAEESSSSKDSKDAQEKLSEKGAAKTPWKLSDASKTVMFIAVAALILLGVIYFIISSIRPAVPFFDETSAPVRLDTPVLKSASELFPPPKTEEVLQPPVKEEINQTQPQVEEAPPSNEAQSAPQESPKSPKEEVVQPEVKQPEQPPQLSQESKQTSAEKDARDEEIAILKAALLEKQQTVDQLKSNLEMVRNSQTSTAAKLRYTIKAKKQFVSECYVMERGQWNHPSNCALGIVANAKKVLQEDKDIVVFEVQGIVDTRPYKGLSPELKQKGLASFRAQEAIKALQEKVPTVIAFEGPSAQEDNHRGYKVKAYVLTEDRSTSVR